MTLKVSQEKVSALLRPRNVVIVGASDRPGSWAARVWRNINRYGFSGPIYPINPRREEIWDGPCYGDFSSLPEAPDHAVILIPAPGVPDVLRELGKAGGRSATIFTSGFGELADAKSQALAGDLEAAISESGLAVSGPNCFGNYNARDGFVSFVEDAQLELEPGPVALVGQSGGILMFSNHVFTERGMAASYIVSSGNEPGLATADYIAYFATDPNIRVIVCYLEAVKDMGLFLEAARAARDAGKTVIVLKLGQSADGRAAARDHTGALPGRADAFDAVAGPAGVIRVDTLDEAVETAEFVVHSPRLPTGRRLAGMTLSGAYRGLLLEAAARSGLEFPALAPDTDRKLNETLSVGSIVGNPLDGGYGVIASTDNYLACLEALEKDPNVDILLLQEELPRAPGNQRGERYIELIDDYVVNRGEKPIVCVAMLSHSQSDFSRELHRKFPHIAFLQEPSRTIGVIERVVRAHELQALDAAAEAATFEFPATAEKLAKTLREDARAAGAEGRELSPEECKGLIEAFEIASVDGTGDVGMSLRLGVLRDRESGPVILAATGGGKEPIPANTAFAAPPMTHDKAMDMLARCGALDQIKACGGDGPYDIDALTQALAGLDRLAGALGDVIESLDIDPFAAGPKGQGGIAGKARGVLRTAALPGPETTSNEGRKR